MTPAQRQLRVQVLLSAGLPPTITVGDPGVQGATVLGMQGIGVNVPNAAAVAVATCGFAIEVHIINGLIFIIGLLSIIVAAGFPPAFTNAVGKIFNVLGPVPKLHIICAPEQTCCAILSPVEIGRLLQSPVSTL